MIPAGNCAQLKHIIEISHVSNIQIQYITTKMQVQVTFPTLFVTT